MQLDPQAQKLLDAAKASGLPPVYTLPVDEARCRMASLFITKDNKEDVFSIQDVAPPNMSVKLRIYRPSPDLDLPIIVFYHGGGWVLNSIETHDDLCRSLCNDAGAIVASIDYRLAPEHPFPAAIEDAYVALTWLAENAKNIGGNARRIAVAGDSSGGNQAAVVSLMSRDKGGPNICFQWLIYPVLDYYNSGFDSYSEMATGYSMNRDFMIWFWDHYLPRGVSPDNPYICPLKANNLSKLPPAFIISAHFDPLRDEAAAYARRLTEAGIPVEYKCALAQMHGFMMQRVRIDEAKSLFREAVDALRRGVGSL